MDLTASRNQLAAFLSTAELDDGRELPVVLRLDQVRTPCAFIQIEKVEPYNVGGEATWRVYLVGDNTDEERVLEQLEDLLTAVLTLGISPAADIEYVGLPVPEQSQPLPAFLVRINDTV